MNYPSKITRLILAAGMAATITSCNAIFTNHISFHAGTAAVQRYASPDGGKDMIFMPMVHVGPPEFYDNIKGYIDSLRAENYVVFYEGILSVPPRYDSLMAAMPDKTIFEIAGEFPGNDDDVAELDILNRKERKICGFNIPHDYTDPENKSIGIKSITQNKKYVGQTNELLGITRDDVHVDLTVSRMITGIEERYGEIPLTEYDLGTGLDDKYRPRGRNKTWTKKEREERYNYLQKLRNDHLAASIAESEHPRIVVVYGQRHLYAVARRLTEMGWERGEIDHKFYKYY